MQPQRETMAGRLADLIHIIRIGGKSGVLMVERGERQTVEEGFITFVDGRVVEAQVGPKSGFTAFNYLNTWQACRFALVGHVANGTSSSSSLTRLPPLTPKSGMPDNASTANAIIPFNSRTLVSKDNGSYQYRNGAGARPTPPLRLQVGEEMLQQSGRMQLSRIHRRLLLLIDGQRGIHDLARLMARTFDQVQELLNDLEHSGLIRQ